MIRIDVTSRALEGADTVTVPGNGARPHLGFALHPDARVHAVTHAGKSLPFEFKRGLLEIPQSVLPQEGSQKITIRYTAAFRDAIPQDPSTRRIPRTGWPA